jgi:TPR repeat protein
LLRLILIAALLGSAAATARAAQPTIDECDRLAAHPHDQDRVRVGVRFADLNVDAVISACEAALAADPEEPRFHFQYARALQKAERLPETLRHYRRAARRGYAASQYALGLLMGRSRALPGGDRKALNWFQRAADGGHVLAQYTIGLIHHAGRGVPKNDVTAVRWFRIAAAQGLPQAQYNLGWMFEQGFGVERDTVVAAGWYRRAADQGYGRARFALAALEGDTAPFDEPAAPPPTNSVPPPPPTQATATPTGTATQASPPAPQAAAAPTATPAQASPLAAQIAAAMTQATPAKGGNDGLTAGLQAYRATDYATALKIWMPLARQNVRRAQFYVGGMFAEGRGTALDNVQAFLWLTRAAARGERAAMPLLGELNARMSADELARARELIAGGG